MAYHEAYIGLVLISLKEYNKTAQSEREVAVVGQIFLDGFLHYDFIIFVAFALNIVFFFKARDSANTLSDMVSPKINQAAWQNIDFSEVARSVMAIDDQDLMDSRARSERWYSWFVNLTAIFPLLGILGTVKSLLPMVADMENMQHNFFAALTSTMWGLIFAIVCKFADAPLAAKIEENDKELELLLARRSEKEVEESVLV